MYVCVYMYTCRSPTLVPKPKDWPDHVDVVGAFEEQTNYGEGLYVCMYVCMYIYTVGSMFIL